MVVIIVIICLTVLHGAGISPQQVLVFTELASLCALLLSWRTPVGRRTARPTDG